MSIIGLLRRKKTQDIEDRDDGISIRTEREQRKYLKSTEYQRVLNDIEELKALRKTRRKRKIEKQRIYNKHRYRLEQKLIESRIKSEHIPTINLQEGITTYSDKG